MSNFAKKIGLVIREKRQNLGLSQEALASLSGINRSYLGEVERGEAEISAAKLQRVAEGLGIKLSELILLYEENSG